MANELSAMPTKTCTKCRENKCAICRQPETNIDRRTGALKRLAVDHCYASGVVRGLLCFNCNTAIGKMGDDPERLRLAADYLGGAE